MVFYDLYFKVTIIIFQSMTERQKWTIQQDQTIKCLKEGQKQLNWSEIAQFMSKTFFHFKKTGKQCRQRFHSHLQKENVSNQWTLTDKLQLSQLHNKFGNKWAKIADEIGNRTDNCVKNYFYSCMRKSVRRLNLIIRLSHIKNLRDIKFNDICVILDAFDSKFRSLKVNSKWTQQELRNSQQIKNQMFQLSEVDLQSGCIQINEQLLQLIKNISDFLRIGRKKLKKHNIKKIIDKNYFPQSKIKKTQIIPRQTFSIRKYEQNAQFLTIDSIKTQHNNNQILTNITNVNVNSNVTNSTISLMNIMQFNNQQIIKECQPIKNFIKNNSNSNVQLEQLNYPTFRMNLSKMENEQGNIQNEMQIEYEQIDILPKGQSFNKESLFLDPLSFRSFKSFKSYSSLDNTLFS